MGVSCSKDSNAIRNRQLYDIMHKERKAQQPTPLLDSSGMYESEQHLLAYREAREGSKRCWVYPRARSSSVVSSNSKASFLHTRLFFVRNCDTSVTLSEVRASDDERRCSSKGSLPPSRHAKRGSDVSSSSSKVKARDDSRQCSCNSYRSDYPTFVRSGVLEPFRRLSRKSLPELGKISESSSIGGEDETQSTQPLEHGRDRSSTFSG